ncbi:MAG: PadR family transcriptional regulator [Candidatus Bathyarchaeia archaeon]
MFHPIFLSFKHWMRHMASVPKGFLRYQVLELLNERPLSGSEIMDEIERRTCGVWRPSPGSVYPLLAWLHESGYITEVPTQEVGIRRYALTEKGKQLLEGQRRMRERARGGWKIFAPPLLCTLWLRIPPEEAEKLRVAVSHFIRSLFNLCLDLETKFSGDALNEVLRVLNEAAQRFEEMDRKLLGE